MLHLQPRVHLEKVEVPASVDEKLHGPRADVAGSARHIDGGASHRRTQPRVQSGTRRFLDDLLVSALNAAVALIEMHEVALPVPEDLEFDVPRPIHELLQVHAGVSEGRLRDAPGLGEGRRKALGLGDERHPLAAAARARLDEKREPDLDRLARELWVRSLRSVGPGNHRHSRSPGLPARGELVSHLLDRGGGRPDPEEPLLFDGSGKSRALRQKPVAGMDGVRAGLAGGFEKPLDRQVCLQG